MTETDKLIAGEGAVNHYWTLCFANEKMRQRLGLKYISQMRDDSPYWYLWFDEFPGAFKLSMLECKSEFSWDWHALFRIKYYPHPQESSFQGLSVLEQVCRMSEVFDTRPAHWEEGETGCVCHGGAHMQGVRFSDLMEGTGVPRIQRAAEIPEDFFLAGQMELFHREGLGSKVVWESQDLWQVKMTENYYMPDRNGATLKVLRRGDVDREFPGWMLTDFVARRFAIGWQEHFGFARVQEATEEREGVVFTSDGQTVKTVKSPSIRHRLVNRRMRH
jgi:hypothetical protein